MAMRSSVPRLRTTGGQKAPTLAQRMGQPGSSTYQHQRALGQQEMQSRVPGYGVTPNYRLQATQQFGQQNMAGIQGDPRMQQFGIADTPSLGFMPAANQYRQDQSVDSRWSGHPVGPIPPSLATQLGLARIPSIQGGNVADVAYNPGAPGSSPFVSDGPISEGPGQVINRGAEAQQRMDRMKRQYGVTTPMQEGFVGPQLPDTARTGQLGTLARATPQGNVRLIGPIAQNIMQRTGMTDDHLTQQRIGGSGIATTHGPDGEVVATHPEEQGMLDTRVRRRREVAAFRNSRRNRGSGVVPGGIPGGTTQDTAGDGLTEPQRNVVQGAFTPTVGPDGLPVPQDPAESLKMMYLSQDFTPASAAAALRGQMTQQEFTDAMNSMRGGFFGNGEESPEVIAWLEKVAHAWGIPGTRKEQSQARRAAGSYVPSGMY